MMTIKARALGRRRKEVISPMCGIEEGTFQRKYFLLVRVLSLLDEDALASKEMSSSSSSRKGWRKTKVSRYWINVSSRRETDWMTG